VFAAATHNYDLRSGPSPLKMKQLNKEHTILVLADRISATCASPKVALPGSQFKLIGDIVLAEFWCLKAEWLESC
jgi:hypothetical protein